MEETRENLQALNRLDQQGKTGPFLSPQAVKEPTLSQVSCQVLRFQR